MLDTDHLERRLRNYTSGDLYLTGYKNLKSLPDNFYVSGHLYLSNCTSLRTIPPNLLVDGYLKMQGCNSLQSVGSNLKAHSVDWENCVSLKTLPDDLTTTSYLDLSGCTSLESLPKNLTVGNDIYLHGCTALRSLPPCLKATHISVNGCNALLSEIPNVAFSSIEFIEGKILADLDYNVKKWCRENGIKIQRQNLKIKPFPIVCWTIDDPSEMMLYRLKWD